MESYKHKFAKTTLMEWLRQPYFTYPLPHWSTTFCEEYPVALDSHNVVHGIFKGLDGETYESLLKQELLPIAIFDIAAFHTYENDDDEPPSSSLMAAIEVVHKHRVSSTKLDYLRRVEDEAPGFKAYEIDADWILSRCGRPEKLNLVRVFP